MRNKLLIIGAGGHGRCCLDIAREEEKYDIIHFLDDNGVGTTVNDVLIIDCISNLQKYINEYDVFVAVGNNKLREQILDHAERLGFNIETLISKKSVISPYAVLGRGSVVLCGVVIEANATIGQGCIIAANSVINHDAILESYSLINSNTVIRPNARVKRGAKVGSRCIVTFGKIVEQECEIQDGTVF